jgi:hypothetical protein
VFKTTWNVNDNLIYKRPDHILHHIIDTNSTNLTHQLCQSQMDQQIRRSTNNASITVTSEQYHQLLLYGELTSDNIMTLYIKAICQQYKCTYLSTYFIPTLLRDGWDKVKSFFANQHRNRQRSISRPHLNGEQYILTPTFVNGNHWVALVHNQCNNQVLFMYCDDLNCVNTEQPIRPLIYNETDVIFCPVN